MDSLWQGADTIPHVGNSNNSVPPKDNPGDMGPLPRVDDNAALQNKSLAAMRLLFSKGNLFCLRDERIEDYGVDASIEVVSAGFATNCRSQIQIKAVARIEPNADGSWSKSIKTTNLNYLLNGPSPIYVVFDVASGVLRFAWAHDEARELNSKNPDWMKQGEITLRFSMPLDADALVAISERVVKESRLNRDIQSRLARSTTYEAITLSIDLTSLQTTDGVAARELLMQAGITIVAYGYPKEVIRLIGLLNAAEKVLPRVQIAHAYAEFALGRYQSALGRIGECFLAKESLSTNDQSFLCMLKDGCEYRLGRLSAKDYSERSRTRFTSGNDSFSLLNLLESLRHQIVACEAPPNPKERIADLEKVVSKLAAIGCEEPVLLQARLHILFLRASLLALADINRHATIQARKMAGLPLEDVIKQFNIAADRGFHEWLDECKEAIATAQQLCHPVLLLDAFYIQCTGSLIILQSMAACFVVMGASLPFPKDAADEIAAQAELLIREYQRIDSFDSVLRANMLLAAIQELFGLGDRGVSIMSLLVEQAHVMGYQKVERHARDFLGGKSYYQVLIGDVRRLLSDPDKEISSLSDADVKEYASHFVSVMKIPKARLGIVEDDVKAERNAATERLTWCQSLQLLQDFQHMQSPETMFACDLLPET
jgi:hypothetical protein